MYFLVAFLREPHEGADDTGLFSQEIPSQRGLRGTRLLLLDVPSAHQGEQCGIGLHFSR